MMKCRESTGKTRDTWHSQEETRCLFCSHAFRSVGRPLQLHGDDALVLAASG